MIVIGLDVHKQSVTAVAVDEAGRPLAEKLILVGSTELPDWAIALDADRLWAVEDCRQLTRWLEQQLLSLGEEVVRVPPKLTVPERRAGRTRGKSDPIDALAIARAAIREPGLSRPRPDERIYRELKLLVDHRDDLVDQRRRTQQRLRWHLHALDPTYEVPLRRLDRATQLERVSRWLARREQELQVRIARDLVSCIRQLNRLVNVDHRSHTREHRFQRLSSTSTKQTFRSASQSSTALAGQCRSSAGSSARTAGRLRQTARIFVPFAPARASQRATEPSIPRSPTRLMRAQRVLPTPES